MIHFTTEILNSNIGGIGSVLSQLYLNKEPNDRFVLISIEKQRPEDLPKDVFYLNYKDYLNNQSIPGLNIESNDVVFVHHLALMKKNMPGKVQFVSHSNIDLEFKINPLTGIKAVEQFYFSMKNSDGIVCVSESEKKLMKELCLKHIGPKKIQVAYNGLTASKNPEFKESGYFGYIGRMDIRKGIFHLTEQFPKNEKLLIASGGSEKYLPSSYRTFLQICRNHNQGQIIPVGFCSGQRKLEFFEKIECLIIPSLYEPFGMVALEAMAMNRPIIATKVGGLVEILGEDHPLYFNITDNSSLPVVIEKYKKLSFSEKSVIVKRQRERLALFSSEKMSEAYRKIAEAS